MEKVQQQLEKLCIDTSDNAVDAWIDELFASDECGIPKSQSLVRRLVRMSQKKQCITCRAFFASRRALVRHLKETKHHVDPDSLRDRREALARRIYPEHRKNTERWFLINNPQQFPLLYDDMDEPEKDTAIALFMDRAYMICINRA